MLRLIDSIYVVSGVFGDTLLSIKKSSTLFSAFDVYCNQPAAIFISGYPSLTSKRENRCLHLIIIKILPAILRLHLSTLSGSAGLTAQ